MKSMKKTLIASAVSIVLCAALLVGATFAWFTDSIVNKGNKIQAGNLKIEATAYDLGTGGTTVEIAGGGVDNSSKTFTFEQNGEDLRNSKAPVINDSGWEPGMISAKLLEVRNEGNLKVKVKVDFVMADGFTDSACNGLTPALWFDFVKINDEDKQEGDFSRKEMTSLSAVADTVEIPLGPKGSAEQADNARFVFVYGMKEDAGNEFQDKYFRRDITIMATQNVDGAEYATSAADRFSVSSALAAGQAVSLSQSIEDERCVGLYKNHSAVLDLNGKNISNTYSGSDTTPGRVCAIQVTNGHLTINGSGNVSHNFVAGKFCMAVYAHTTGSDFAKITINGGNYFNVGDATVGPNAQYDLIYAAGNSLIEINGGTYRCQTPKWTLNLKDGNAAQIVVRGGSFFEFNPAEAYTEPAPDSPKSFVAEGYKVVSEVKADGTWYTVVKA